MPKISIIIPIYNKGMYLNNLWDTLQKQSLKDFECILVDDGSTDQSGDLCDEIALKDKRFKVFHIKNGGVSHARNIALEYVTGDYITFIDADDCIHPEFLDNLFRCMNENKVDIVIGPLVKVWADSKKQEIIQIPYIGKKELSSVIDDFAKVQLSTGIYGFCCGKLVHKNLIGTIRFNEEIRLAEDLDFYISLYPKIKSIYFDDKGYYYYLQAAENSSMQGNDDKIDYYVQLCIQLKIYNFLEEMNALSSENKRLMINRIYDYIFFTLYHASCEKVKEYCIKIKKLNLPENPSYPKDSWRKKWIIGLYEKKWNKILVLTKQMYDFVKKIRSLCFGKGDI